MPKVKQIYLFFLLIISTNCYGQKYQLFGFTENEGLSSYNVQTICQDKYGYIWAGTQDGLNKYNGKSFEIYNKFSTPKLSGNDIRCVYYDSVKNYLWICSTNGGVDALNLETNQIDFTLPIDTIKKYLPDPSVQNIVFINQEEFCINTPSGILIYNYIRKRTYPNIVQPFRYQNQGNNFVTSVAFGDGKLITVSLRKGVSIYKEKRIVKEIPFTADMQDKFVYDLIYDKEINQFFICSSGGLYIFSAENFSISKVNYQNYFSTVFCFSKYKDDYILGTDKGIFKLNYKTNAVVKIQFVTNSNNEDWEINTNNIFVDRDAEIWYAARKGLMVQPPHISAFEKYNYDPNTNLRLNHLYYLGFDKPDKVIACGIDQSFTVSLNTNSIKQIKSTEIFYYLFTDFNNKKIISRSDGIYAVNDFEEPVFVKVDLLYPEMSSIQKFKLNSHILLNDTTIILLTEAGKGAFLWNKKSKTITQLFDRQTLLSQYSNGIAKVSDTSFLIATDSEIAYYNLKTKVLRLIPIANENGKPQRLFLDVKKIKNTYWVACYGSGIYILNANFKVIKILSTENGLSNNSIYRMIEDKFSNVWVTTNFGLNKINSLSFNIKAYFVNDGLHNNAFEEFSANSNDDIIVVGGPNGFTKINPERLSDDNKPLPCLFENIRLNDGFNTKTISLLNELSEIEIPNNVIKADLSVVSINFDLSTELKYAYRIKELGNNWFSLGTKNLVSLIGLSPGTYHLQVKASNEDGVWSEPKELILIFLPKWYQTWWFYLLIALTVAGILYALYRYRIAQIKKQHTIRKNIATDLHDDLGSTLNSVKVFTNLAISGVKQEESLQQVKDNLTEATMSLRDMIWVLDDSLDTVDELITRLKQFAMPVAAASNIEAVIKADSEVNSRQLTKEEKRNLFLICKEAINNSIKYSGASCIDVSITASGKKIQIVVADNGKGFNVDEVKKGYGLKNMQYRAGQIKYKVVLNSLHGTEIIILPT